MRAHMHQAVYITQENAGCRGPSPEALGHGQILIGKVKNWWRSPLKCQTEPEANSRGASVSLSVVCWVCFVIRFKTLPGVSWFVSPGESGPPAPTASAGAVTATPVSIKLAKRSEGLECPPKLESDIYGHSDDRWCFNVLLLWVCDLHAFSLWQPVAEKKVWFEFIQQIIIPKTWFLICWWSADLGKI